MEYKTIIQIFADEYAAGTEWAKKAMINTLTSEKDRAAWKQPNTKLALSWAFVWMDTPEGFEYWGEIFESLS
jgi:hypothetical protein